MFRTTAFTQEAIPATVVDSGAESDPRFKTLQRTMRQHQYQPDALIEVLHKAQEVYGYLDKSVLRAVSRELQLPASHVYGVATFYSFFSHEPPGEHKAEVCMGTTCYMKGGGKLLKALERETGIGAGETTADGKLSLLSVRCPGTCGGAPVVVLDGELYAEADVDSVVGHVRAWME
jgi:bidirectional [NiFe] hydrogenase diaphorase subunit